MLKTIDLLKQIIVRNNLKTREGEEGTAYSLWKHMHGKYGWTKAAVSYYFSEKSFPDRPQCIHIAAELALDPAHVMAIVDADREKNPQIKAILEEAALQLSPDNRAHRGRPYNHDLGAYQHKDEFEKYQRAKAKRAGVKKTARMASAILSLGLLTAVAASGVDVSQALDFSGSFERVSFVSAGAAIEECVLC